MTDQELRDLVASLAASQVETDRELKEVTRGIGELREESRETDRHLRETGERIRALSESADRSQRELRESQRETGLQIKELGQQIGGLGEKFGTYTEGLAETGVRKLLKERFGTSAVTMGYEVTRNGESMEIDGLGYSNTGRDAVYVVEIKSKLRRRGIDQLLRILRRFPEFFPQHRGKRLYGVLAVAEVPPPLVSRVLDQGIYLARLGSTVELAVPDDFEPRSYQ